MHTYTHTHSCSHSILIYTRISIEAHIDCIHLNKKILMVVWFNFMAKLTKLQPSIRFLRINVQAWLVNSDNPGILGVTSGVRVVG